MAVHTCMQARVPRSVPRQTRLFGKVAWHHQEYSIKCASNGMMPFNITIGIAHCLSYLCNPACHRTVLQLWAAQSALKVLCAINSRNPPSNCCGLLKNLLRSRSETVLRPLQLHIPVHKPFRSLSYKHHTTHIHVLLS